MKILSILICIIAILITGCSKKKENLEETSQKKSITVKDQKTKVQKTISSNENKRSNICPKCGSPGVPIVHGKPGKELLEKAEKKEIYLGGCSIMKNSPRYHCYQCKIDFGYEK